VFVPDKPFQPSLVYAGKAGAYDTGPGRGNMEKVQFEVFTINCVSISAEVSSKMSYYFFVCLGSEQ